ncbi:hypothetical protein U6M73_10660 [Cutibacterium acnes]
MTLAVAETAVFPRIDATMSGLMAVRTVVTTAVTSTAGTPETGVRTVTAGAMIAVMTAGQTARITAATTGPVTTTTTTIWIGRPLS